MKPLKPIPKNPPIGGRAFGTMGAIGIDIFIDSPVLRGCVEYARTNMSQMLMGMLVGEYCASGGREYVRVRGLIPATKAESRSASVKLTQEAWAEIVDAKDRNFPGLPLVGWMQTHPGFGIFMSEMSLALHKQFFDLKWHVALTIDPVSDKLGFFGWNKAEIEKSGFTTVPETA